MEQGRCDPKNRLIQQALGVFDLFQIKPVRWRRSPCRRTIGFLNQRLHEICWTIASSNLYQGSDHRSNHVSEKSIGLQRQVSLARCRKGPFRPSKFAEVVFLPPATAGKSPKIPSPRQGFGGPDHGVPIGLGREPPRTSRLKRILVPMNSVSIGS